MGASNSVVKKYCVPSSLSNLSVCCSSKVKVAIEGKYDFKTKTTTYSLQNDDNTPFKAKVERMKQIMKSDNFRENFFDFMGRRGKLPYIQCAQKMEKLRTLIILSISCQRTLHDQPVQMHGPVEASVLSLRTELHATLFKHKQITTNNLTGRYFPVFQECSQIFVDLEERNLSYAQVAVLNRIRGAENVLLACLFDEFEEFLNSEEFQNIVTPRLDINNQTLPANLFSPTEQNDSFSDTSISTGSYSVQTEIVSHLINA